MCIILQKEGKSTYDTNGIGVKVEQERYKHSSLFVRYSHYVKGSLKQRNILFCVDNGLKKFTLNLDGQYLSEGLSNIDVYFNKYDKKIPLILVLYFTNADIASPKYLKYSEFRDKLILNGTIPISRLKTYVDQNDGQNLLDDLLKENDSIPSLLTYRIDWNTEKNYNGNKINVSRHKVDEQSDLSHGFYKLIHRPITVVKTSCVLYNNNVMLSAKIGQYVESDQINEIQNQSFESVSVYWSNKINVPLMIEFSITDYTSSYYVHRKSKTTNYWQELNLTNWKDFLGDEITEETQIHTKLTSNNEELLKVLRKVEYFLLNTLIILTNKHDPYNKNEFDSVLSTAFGQNMYNPVCTSAQPQQITVSQKHNYCIKLKEKGYCVYEHQIVIPKGLVKEGEKIELKLLTPNGSNNTYSEIRLYNNNNLIDNNNRFYIYCLWKDSNTTINVYTYFYGSDPRPLGVIINGDLFVPSSIEGYYNKWIKSENIGNGECQGAGTYEKLLTALSKVVGFLNVVKLDQRPGSMTEQEPNKNGNPDETKLYELQQYDGKTIQVQVSYQNKRCYRILTHKPHGSDSQGQGYRLGTIIFSNSSTKNSEISYDLKRQLISVSLCYYVYDNDYEYPFLVVLEFKDSKNKYYKLTSSGKPYQWAKMDNNNIDNVEELARRVKDELQIDFTKKKKKSHLFDPKDCNEHSSSGAVAGTLSALGLTAFGTGVAYYKYPEVFETLYRRLVHLVRLRSYY